MAKPTIDISSLASPRELAKRDSASWEAPIQSSVVIARVRQPLLPEEALSGFNVCLAAEAIEKPSTSVNWWPTKTTGGAGASLSSANAEQTIVAAANAGTPLSQEDLGYDMKLIGIDFGRSMYLFYNGDDVPKLKGDEMVRLVHKYGYLRGLLDEQDSISNTPVTGSTSTSSISSTSTSPSSTTTKVSFLTPPTDSHASTPLNPKISASSEAQRIRSISTPVHLVKSDGSLNKPTAQPPSLAGLLPAASVSSSSVSPAAVPLAVAARFHKYIGLPERASNACASGPTPMRNTLIARIKFEILRKWLRRMSATPLPSVLEEEPATTSNAESSSSSSSSSQEDAAKPFVQPAIFANKPNAEEAQANRNASILGLMIMNICTQKNLRVLKQKVAEALEEKYGADAKNFTIAFFRAGVSNTTLPSTGDLSARGLRPPILRITFINYLPKNGVWQAFKRISDTDTFLLRAEFEWSLSAFLHGRISKDDIDLGRGTIFCDGDYEPKHRPAWAMGTEVFGIYDADNRRLITRYSDTLPTW
eukprot:TRINITY_DN666_c0_g1_i1.p1 TRINITY_DN666_c0_g1~~TRINITY_DN666_c0_g1_i1.p1  ORF type:complete len:533 (-),score=99.36 TRINITY_DN666_c0_g1_i1:158-1756(-)